MTVYYFYDDTGAPLGMRLLNNAGTLTTYYYRKNLQGDIPQMKLFESLFAGFFVIVYHA